MNRLKLINHYNPAMVADDIAFQVLNWYAGDAEALDDSESSDSSDNEVGDTHEYVIKMFGVDAQGDSVSLTVTGFEPHFYIKLAKRWSLRHIEVFVECLRVAMPFALRSCSIQAKMLLKKDFWGFTNGTTFPFLRLAFKSEKAMRAAARVLAKPLKGPAGLQQRVFKLYESNISPMLRFAHIQDIPSVGWVRVEGRAKSADVWRSRCKRDFQTHWKNVRPHTDRSDIAPLTIAAFDIECNSTDGDFPVANKTYQKIANDVYNLNTTATSAADFSKRAVELVTSLFSNGAVIPFSPTPISELEDKVYSVADHLRVIASGDSSLMKNALKIRFMNVFTSGGSETYDRFVAFYDKVSETSKSSVALRRALTSWIEKCLDGNERALTWEAKGAIEDLTEELVSYLMRDKDAVVCVLSNYLGKILPRLKGDEIIQIGSTFHRYGETHVSRKVIINLGECDHVEDTEVIVCNTETELIETWCKLIESTDPDVITGYNILGFDFAYIHDRACELGCTAAFNRLGRIVDLPTNFKEARLSSSALGDNVLRYLDTHGRTIIDLMKVVQRDHKLDSYKLDTVASHFMKMNKVGVSPQQIFDLYKGGDPRDIARIAEYCVQDCALCNQLVMKLEIIANNVGMANVCSVPLSYIFMRGQGVKIFSLIAKECKANGFLVPTISKGDGEEDASYEGAIVLEPKTGIYIDTPIAVLDYASLYPSSMISENLSHDCLVLDSQYDNLEGVAYSDVAYDVYDVNEAGDKVKVGEKVCRFAQPSEGGQEGRGVLPNILMHLLRQRKLTRKRMETKVVTLRTGEQLRGFYRDNMVYDEGGQSTPVDADDVESVRDAYNAFEKATLDGLQLAYKITANSLYGQMGARTSPVYLKDIAACTTATGRKMILLAKDFLEKQYDAEIVYGDSVTGDTPVIIKCGDGRMNILEISKLSQEWRPIRRECSFVKAGDQKEEAFVSAEVWCKGAWARINRVIRHKTNKKIHRIVSTHGAVDVTEDHSLISADTFEPLAPRDVQPGVTLLAGDIGIPFDTNVCVDHNLGARLAGMPDEHRSSEAAFARLNAVLNASQRTHAAFVAGMFTRPQIQTRNARFAQYCCVLYKSATKRDLLVKKSGDTIVLTQPHNHTTDNLVESADILGSTDDYVYDIETEDGVFHGGVGSLLLKNTDSLFVHFPSATRDQTDKRQALVKTIEMGKQASNAIKPVLKPPHDLEYEKTFWPFILFSKKRYVANQYGMDADKFKQTSMGIVLKRRDNANIVKRIYGGVIDIILNKHDIRASVEFLEKSLKSLIKGAYPLDELVISKTLKAHYKDPSRIAHKVLADRIKERSPGNAPQVNDRIPYIYVFHEDAKKMLQGDRIEHPDYIREMQLKPDYAFYITNQVMNPVLQVFAIVLEQLEGYNLSPRHWDDLATHLASEGKTPQQVRERIAHLREIEVKRLLFDPILKQIEDDPERKMAVNRKNGNRTITEWFKAASIV